VLVADQVLIAEQVLCYLGEHHAQVGVAEHNIFSRIDVANHGAAHPARLWQSAGIGTGQVMERSTALEPRLSVTCDAGAARRERRAAMAFVTAPSP